MSTTEDAAPRISVIIPTLNEARYIEQALQCIVDNGIPMSEMEVLLIDGGSRDDTVQAALRYANRLQLCVIDAPGCTVYRALNIGLQASRGLYFVRVDARSAIPARYIETCLSHLEKPSVKCAGGIQLQYGNTRISDSIAWVTSSKLGSGGAKFRTATDSGFVDSVYLGVYRTATLRELVGFEDRSDYVSEDALINKRIRVDGGKVYLDANLKVRYPAKATFRALAKQYVIYGAAKAFLVRKHHQLTSVRQIIPPLFLLSWVALLLANAAGWLPWVALGTAACAYLLLVIAGNLGGRRLADQRAGSLWARCIATACIHFAWPIGFFLFLISPPLHKRLAHWL